MFGDAGAIDDHACGLPVEMQMQRLENELRSLGATCFTVTNPDLYDLVGDDRHAALDGVVAGLPGPYVIVDGQVVCAGRIDAGLVSEALARAATSEQAVAEQPGR